MDSGIHNVALCLVLLALTCAASLLARVVRLPLPFLQIGIGVAAALPPFGFAVALDPEAFLLLFIPPLLFGDGWNLPRRELLAERWPVLGRAVGLVLLTVVAGGYGLHWLVPAMPLSVAFAVAALVSPTDAVAVSAITERVRVPRRMRYLLESEALLNDASGLVALRFAVAATLSGRFSLGSATLTFLVVAVGGLAIGYASTLAYAQFYRRLLVHERDAALQTVLSGLLPFAAYGLAELAGVSGILAAVAAGVAASRVGLLEPAHFSARLQSGHITSVLSFCLNGVIFVLLGLQLPGIVGAGPNGINLLISHTRIQILGQVVVLTAMLIGLRFVWVLTSALLERRGKTRPGERARGEREGWRMLAASSLAGVRGMITLAGALSLPLLLPDGTLFPSRELAITLATGVILFSMLIAAVGLPLLLRQAQAVDDVATQESHLARAGAIEAAILAVSGASPPLGEREAALVGTYRKRLLALGNAAVEESDDVAWRDLHRTALRAERGAVQKLRGAAEIDDIVARRLLDELDIVEAALMRRRFDF